MCPVTLQVHGGAGGIMHVPLFDRADTKKSQAVGTCFVLPDLSYATADAALAAVMQLCRLLLLSDADGAHVLVTRGSARMFTVVHQCHTDHCWC
jgi:hypothetical protein